MISTTPLAEFIDMVYNRMMLEMIKYPQIEEWYVKLEPPIHWQEWLKQPVDAGYVRLYARTDERTLSYRVNLYAVQRGAEVSTEVLETVVEHHITKFVKAIVE